MLSSLHIQNYAIIRKLEIDFRDGLSTLTGETGAGKSILLGALSLILGQRADSGVLQDKSRKCVIEGQFNEADDQILRLLKENELDCDLPLILRREIAASGKSRAFVNDTPVNLILLKEIGTFLVDIHSQHENLDLSRQKYQMDVIDAYGNHSGMRNDYQEKYREYRTLKEELNQLDNQRRESLSRLDFVRFQLEELENAKLVKGEFIDIETEIVSLQHSEEIKSGLFQLWDEIDGAEGNVISRLRVVLSGLEKISKYHPASEELTERMESLLIELKDISGEAELLGEKIEHDPGRLQFLEERLNLLNGLFQKHHVKDEKELLDLRNSFSDEIASLETMEFKMDDLRKTIEGLEDELSVMAGKLSDKRKKASEEFTGEIVVLLQQLGIPNAKFAVSVEAVGELSETGQDKVIFLFAANKNSELQELNKVASGGEMSRLMLSIKSVISYSLGLPTIIFDEIDTGVSGEIAHRIGNLMKEMSAYRQVLAVTHLPQVAACGKQHYFVFKEDGSSGTETRLKKLEADERIVEIAKMLSGEATTDAAIENARDLLHGN